MLDEDDHAVDIPARTKMEIFRGPFFLFFFTGRTCDPHIDRSFSLLSQYMINP